ncbi:MAG TPA: 50S ribosomal protein L11 methyltransferase [Verrucomicrobiota bacterium]|nr:50S ribosomal protein L11 methyltransferase [Verrucomicrobiota bacterium]
MKRGPIWRISVTTTAEAEDAVSELLSAVFHEPASAYTDAETRVTVVRIYCPDEPSHLDEKRAALRHGLQRIADCGLSIGAARISIGRIRNEDWAESWKRHFRPIEIGDKLLVKPSWSRRAPKNGQAVVVLDPGLSFGTGQHPTTGYCLRELVLMRKEGTAQSFLDIGTGSGILAIAAAKLCYSPIRAFDFDAEAVRIARANARHNRVLHKIRLNRGDITRFSTAGSARYDFICANLISNLLIAERQRIVRLLSDDGVLVVAGILKTEFHLVRRAYEQCGLRLVASKSQKEWRSGTFKFAAARHSANARK